MKTIYEDDGIEARAHFYTEPGGTAIAPTTASWKLICSTTGTVLQDWTAVSLTQTTDDGGTLIDCYADVEVAGTLNAMQGSGNYEIKTLTIAADQGLSSQKSEVVQYRVNKLK